MRRVKFERLFMVPSENGYGCTWESEKGEGYFHQWGCDFEELPAGLANFSIAIIELDDGTIKNMPSSSITFLDKSENHN